MEEDEIIIPGSIGAPVSGEGCGYEVGGAGVASLQALERLLESLRRLRRTGAETRAWTFHTIDHLTSKLHTLEDRGTAAANSAILVDLTAWEGHILQVIRHYMQE